MKKNILVVLITTGITAGLILSGCSKDDTAAPNITINGSTSEVVSLQSGPWTDAGASAEDEEDGTVSVTSDASTTNPNTNSVGTYTITYTATDAAGNVGTAVRTVRVKNDAEEFARTYQVTDNVPGQTFIYSQIVTVDSTINNKLHFNKFANYENNTSIYAMRDTLNRLTIPSQSSGHDVGTGSGTCDVVEHTFYSTNFTTLSTGFLFNYVDSLSDNAPCNTTSTPGTMEFSF